MDEEMEEHKEQTRTTVKYMTKIYRQMEQSVNEKIVECEVRVEAQESEKKRLKDDISRITKEKEEMMAKMDEELRLLQQRIDTMSSDFAEMLKTTLNKMQERIDDANQTYEGDQPGMENDASGGFN